MHKQFEMASLWVEQRQKRGTIHFHVLLFRFDGQDPQDADAIREAGFRAWQKAVGGTLSRKANAMRIRRKDDDPLEYVLRGVFPSEEFPAESVVTRWWGFRGNELAAKHWKAPSKREVAEFFSREFDTRIATKKAQGLPVKTPRVVYGWGELRRQKATVENFLEVKGCGMDWSDFKRAETGQERKVSDADFILFKNGAKFSEGKIVIAGDDPFADDFEPVKERRIRLRW